LACGRTPASRQGRGRTSTAQVSPLCTVDTLCMVHRCFRHVFRRCFFKVYFRFCVTLAHCVPGRRVALKKFRSLRCCAGGTQTHLPCFYITLTYFIIRFADFCQVMCQYDDLPFAFAVCKRMPVCAATPRQTPWYHQFIALTLHVIKFHAYIDLVLRAGTARRRIIVGAWFAYPYPSIATCVLNL
jgi:hypothetical protein